MNTTIYFDMDGTLFDLYNVPEWLEKLRNEDESPYIDAKPLTDFEKLGKLCCLLQQKGFKIGIISWLSMDSSPEYKRKVRQAKREALCKIPVNFDVIHLVQYGTPKTSVAKEKDSRILFDDNDQVLRQWERGNAIVNMAIDVKRKCILRELERLLT